MSATLTVEPYPFGKRFAIAFVDDTDGVRLPAARAVYEELRRRGLPCTKTVWMRPPTARSGGTSVSQEGDTLADPEYRRFVLDLQAWGCEIAMHTASAGDSTREQTIAAYDEFEEIFGHPPATNVMHARNRENLYWGRFSVPQRWLAALIGVLEPIDFSGHVPESPYYWGDICRERTRYVRLFDSPLFNTRRFDPATPFHDPRKPDVPWWFCGTYAADAWLFRAFRPGALDALARARGMSILYTYLHRYAQLTPDGSSVDVRLTKLLDDLTGRQDGWVVPAAPLLDRIRAVRQVRVSVDGLRLRLRNDSDQHIKSLAIHARGSVRVMEDDGTALPSNAHGQLLVGDLGPGEERDLHVEVPFRAEAVPWDRRPNYLRLASGMAWRILLQFVRGRRRLAPRA